MMLRFGRHAAQRMFERGITQADIHAALLNGEIIEDYPTDYPLPSYLLLGYSGSRPLHIVYANTPQGDQIIITVYEPDTALWTDNFTKRIIR